jgi:hypothetical protein
MSSIIIYKQSQQNGDKKGIILVFIGVGGGFGGESSVY